MTKASNHWGIELEGADEDKNVWRTSLKPPFDPYVEEVREDRGNYLALRSTAFDEAASAKDARRLGETLTKTLNVAIAKHTDADPVSVGAVIEFVSDGQPRKHRALSAPSTVRFVILTFGMANRSILLWVTTGSPPKGKTGCNDRK